MSTDMDREGPRRGSTQKTMLSKALQKANTAVLLDNATNYEGAIEAYTDACELLQQVMARSGGDDEKHKLEEIRNTYTIRIKELGRMGVFAQQNPNAKALPDPPSGDETDQLSPGFEDREGVDNDDDDEDDDEDDIAVIGTATATRVRNNGHNASNSREGRSLSPSKIPPRRQSLLPAAFDEEVRFANSTPDVNQLQETSKVNSSRKDPNQSSLDMSASSDSEPSGRYTPSAKMPLSVYANILPSQPPQKPLPSPTANFLLNPHSRDASNESTSWLDTIDESGPSSNSSVRSRSSLLYIRPRHGHKGSDDTEAEFGAALDAAVEAAYDEGLEPARDADNEPVDDVVINAKRNVELAKQKVREAQMESEAALAKNREQRRIQEEVMHGRFDALDSQYDDDEAEEEERLLEEMMADFEFDLQSKSALPRQSDSSGLSGKTWDGSAASNMTTTGTSLYTLSEDVSSHIPDSRTKADKPPSHHPPPQPPPTTALPSPPASQSTFPPMSPQGYGSSVRDRRLNNQNFKRLSINTSTTISPESEGPRTVPPPSMLLAHPASPTTKVEPKTSLPATHTGNGELRSETPTYGAKPPFMRSDSTDSVPLHAGPTSALSKVTSRDQGDSAATPPLPQHIIERVATAPDNLRKNVSSSSLKGLKARNMSASTPDSSGQSPDTPSSSSFPVLEKKSSTPFYPVLPTPTSALPPGSSLITGGGLNLFDNSIHSPTTPGSPNASTPNAPEPLEPCPQSFLLRPFWLMRCLYQTIAHPRGGYLSTKLFVPKDVWRVQNVKIKGIEEKIANCDLLTAALLKLAQVDTYDADAVLEEMQSFENILDQVQAALTKKLGNEVGVHGSMSLFKTMSAEDATTADSATTRSNITSRSHSGSGKSYLTSWRKLRSKSSGTTPSISSTGIRDGGKDSLVMPSVPMSDDPAVRPQGKARELQCSGPNANYMSALGRLFDAVQVLDQIARQVEDPGLRHTSQTLVGLELSTRHAAEFFGFYVCRFALNDIGLMIDKFIKRGSEWVMV